MSSAPLRSMHDRDFAPLIDMYCRETKNGVSTLPYLPVETNNTLRLLYIDYFRDGNASNPDAVLGSHVAFHAKVLWPSPSAAGFAFDFVGGVEQLRD